MSSRDYHRIDEVYHSMYKNKFHREEPFNTEKSSADEDAEYADKAQKHAPEAAKAIMHKLKLEYGDKFNPEKAKAAVKHALGSTSEEDCEGWNQDYSRTPEQKKEMVRYTGDEAAEETEDDHKAYDSAKFEIERAAKKVVHCLTGYEDSAFDSAPVSVRATPEKAEFEIVSEDKKYKITVELAK